MQRSMFFAGAHDFNAGDNTGGSLVEDVLGTLATTGRTMLSQLIQTGGNLLGFNQEGLDKASGVVLGGAAGLGQVVQMQRDVERKKFDFLSSANVVAPNISFGRFAQMQDYIGNGFFIDRIRLSENDMERFDNFLTMYGYADDRKLENTDFTSHTPFNYVQADNVAVEGPSMYMCNLISEYFSGGVRLWHELPNRAAMTDNPIKGGA